MKNPYPLSVMILGLILLAGSLLRGLQPAWLSLTARHLGSSLALCGLLVLVLRKLLPFDRIFLYLACSVLVFSAVHLVTRAEMEQLFDLRAAADVVACADRLGLVIGTFGDDHEQFGFLARTMHPTETIPPYEDQQWRQAHPRAVMVIYGKSVAASSGPVLYSQAYRSMTLWIVGPLDGETRARLAVCSQDHGLSRPAPLHTAAQSNRRRMTLRLASST